MADQAGWLDTVESELRAVGRDLEVPPARDLTMAVRQRLEGRPARRRHVPGLGTGALRRRRAWRAVLVVVAALLAVLIATPQGRAVIIHVFRFGGVELRQEPGPVRSPVGTPSMPGEQSMALEKARHQVSFPILVPTLLGQPAEVVVSDGGRVVSLIYRRAPYGLVRIDEFAGHLDQIYFEKLVHFSDVTQVEVNGTAGLWIKGPQELLYVTRDGTPVIASARLTTGNTLIWGTRQVALRLEGNLSKATALAIANSAHLDHAVLFGNLSSGCGVAEVRRNGRSCPMLRRLIVVTALAAGIGVGAALSLATPALAKGPSQASITGPGLVHAIVVSGNGEPGEQGTLAVLAGQTGLFTVLFGADAASVAPQPPTQLRTPPPKASLGPQYTVRYTVPGVTPQPGEQFGRIRQDLYPSAVGGPVIYTPPGQDGFSQPLQVTGWLRASPQLTRTLIQLGVPLRPATPAAPQTRPPVAHRAAAHQTGSRTLAWLIAAAVAIAAAALVGAALWRHRKPTIARDAETQSQRAGSGVSLATGLAATTVDAVVRS